MAIPTPDQIWADFNTDGSVKEPAKLDIRRWSRYVEALAKSVGMKTYVDKATMDADVTQDDGQAALVYADPVDANNFPTVWIWDDGANDWIQGTDRVSEIEAAVDVTNGGVDDIKAGLVQQPTRANFKAKTGYAKAWTTISTPNTRWTITEADGAFTIASNGTLPQEWPVGIKMPYDLVPGDTIEAEFKFTSGTIGTAGGPFIGTDTATTGDISTGAIMGHWRNAAAGNGLYFQNYTGQGGVVSGYTTTPQAGTDAQSVPLVTNDIQKIRLQVRSDRSLNIELFVNGVSKLKLLQPGVLPVGRVIVGYVIPLNASATLLSVKRIGFNGGVIHIDSGVSTSGNGMLHAPVKTWDEAVAIALANRLSTLDVKILSAELRAAIVADDKVFPRYRIRGRGGSQTKIISADLNPADWALLGGTTKVYFRPNKNAAGISNSADAGAVYLTGVPMNPKPWYSLPDYILPYNTDPGNVPADLEAKGATGGRRVSGGNLYVRIPDAIGTVPNSTPMEVNNSVATLFCIGAPQIECENIVFSRGGIYNVYLDRATAVYRHCGFEWNESNGTEDAAGNSHYINCWWDASYNDLASRTFPAGYAETLLQPPTSIYDGCRFRRSISGDAISNHAMSIALRSRMRVHNCDIEDITKDGIVPASCDFEISSTRIRRAAQAAIEIIAGGPVTAQAGMIAKGSITDCTLDPGGVGAYCYLMSVLAGGFAQVTVDRTHFNTPVTSEARGNLTAVSGRSSVKADFTTVFTACTTQRTSGTRLFDENSVVTFTPAAANAY